MINVKLADQSDRQKWDAYVSCRSDASPYHLFAWKNAVEKAYNHKGYYLMAEQNGQVVGILPLIQFSLYVLINDLIALPYCDVGNCICDNLNVQDKLLNEAILLGHSLKVKKIQFRGEFPFIELAEKKISPHKNNKVRMLLELPDSSEVLLTNFKSKLRSQIRRAEKNGIHFRWAGQDGVNAFYTVFCRNMRNLGSPIHSRKWIEAVMENYGKNARIGLAEYNGQCIGAGLILCTEKQTAIPWASTLSNFNHLGPNMLLYWNFLKFSADRGMICFDFGRSTEHEGTYKFKKQWGAQPVPLHWYSYTHSTGSDLCMKPGVGKRDVIAQIWKKTPLHITNILGPVFRKYISL